MLMYDRVEAAPEAAEEEEAYEQAEAQGGDVAVGTEAQGDEEYDEDDDLDAVLAHEEEVCRTWLQC